MNYKNYLNYRNSTIIILVISIIFVFLVNASNAALDCSKCHQNVGKSINARDTIEINENTCLKCHNPNYPPTPMGDDTHLVHKGKYSVKVDYIKRHPDATQSYSCDSCHTQNIDCRNCHIKDIPHIKSPMGNNCKECHGEIDKLFSHPKIELKIHNIFNLGDKNDCTMCHNPDDIKSLKLASGDTVPIEEPHRLCYQCHSNYYNLWNKGLHYANKTIPELDAKFPQMKKAWEDNWKKQNTCVNCHNPHNPNELYQIPEMVKTTDMSTLSAISKFYLYIIGIIFIVIVLLVTIKYKDNLKRYNISKTLAQLKLPKISIPISISVEKQDEDKEIKKEEVIKKEDIVREIEPSNIDEIKKTKKPKKNFWNKYRGDILFILSVCIMLGLFYIIFGAFMPVLALVSESMSPNMEKGDVMFYEDISRIDRIRTYNDDKNYISFGNYGDVILYRPSGREDVIPIIHRAMYYVEEGYEMWPGGPKAPYAGYITKGDNTVTNPKYDQQISTSYLKPVKKEWIMGIARYRIPYIGYIRLILP